MTALSETEARHASVASLQAVVGAMSGIAAAHSQRARDLLPAYSAYATAIDQGLADAIALAHPTQAVARAATGPKMVVVFGAEHGFAGDFNGRLLDLASPGPGDELFVLGARAMDEALQRKLAVRWSGPAASQASAVAATARRAADALYEALSQSSFDAADVVFANTAVGAPYRPVRRAILPLDIAAFAARPRGPAPLVELPPGQLLQAVVAEHMFAALALAALESFASENAARLATMQSAKFNIDQKLEALTALERQLRQDVVTTEVQEVVAGALSSSAA